MGCIYSKIKLYHISPNPKLDLDKKIFCTYPNMITMTEGIAGTLGVRKGSKFYVYELTINPCDICYFDIRFFEQIFGTKEGFVGQLKNQEIQFESSKQGYDEFLKEFLVDQSENRRPSPLMNSGLLQHYKILPKFSAVGYYHKTFGGFEVCIYDTSKVQYKLIKTEEW